MANCTSLETTWNETTQQNIHLFILILKEKRGKYFCAICFGYILKKSWLSLFRCPSVAGETGLLVSKITEKAPFNGYARNLQQTEKKRLKDVLQKGDLYFNSGDLLRIDEDNFIYFQDRIGDTFRCFSLLSGRLCTSLK